MIRSSQSAVQREPGARRFRPRLILLIVAVVLAASAARPEEPERPAMSVTLPQSIGGWNLGGPAKRVEPKAIFDYMDGAGELYLGYRFKSLDVYEYKSSSQDEILAELYWMDTSDDAWGLLSGDWGGEIVDLESVSGHAAKPEVNALYGAGLLRICSGDLYARVLAYQETDASKQAVLALGRAIVAGRPKSKAPGLTQVLPPTIGTQFSLRTDRIVFLRSHLVLNSVYFLSQENLLDLGSGCELVAATYREKAEAPSAEPVRVLVVRYADEDAAHKALDHFRMVYLSGKSIAPGNSGTVAIEDGWLGFVLSGRGLGLVFEAPEEASARQFLESLKRALDHSEVSND
jgi:hypothetical protein